MESIRLLIVDDHPIVRQGLMTVLSTATDIQVVGEAGDATSALVQMDRCHPNLILLDMLMPGSSGVVVVRRLKQLHPEIKVIVLTTFEDEEYLFSALRAGADAYILKSVNPETLASTVRAVHRGEQFLSPQLVGKVLGKFQAISKEVAKAENGVSDFEVRILQLAARGASNKEIADVLFTSDSTIKRKMQDLCRKLDAVDRVQAVAEAINRGLI